MNKKSTDIKLIVFFNNNIFYNVYGILFYYKYK